MFYDKIVHFTPPYPTQGTRYPGYQTLPRKSGTQGRNEKEGSPNAYEPGTPERGHRGASTPPAFFKRGKGARVPF